MTWRIKKPKYASQLIDFSGLKIPSTVAGRDDVYPTDIDALIEYQDSEYLIFEIKYRKKQVPKGQQLALQRMADDFTKAGKKAIVFVCEHSEKDTTKPILAANCLVREIYYCNQWRKFKKKIPAEEVLRNFQSNFNWIWDQVR